MKVKDLTGVEMSPSITIRGDYNLHGFETWYAGSYPAVYCWGFVAAFETLSEAILEGLDLQLSDRHRYFANKGRLLDVGFCVIDRGHDIRAMEILHEWVKLTNES